MKSGSKPERAALRQHLLDSGLTLDEVAAQMRARWSFRPREAYRHANGWSQDEAAARYTEVAARLGSGSATAVMVGTRMGEYERWPNGGRRPSPYALTVLAEMYGTRVARLVDDADQRAMPEHERAVVAALIGGSAGDGLPRRVPKPVPPPPPLLAPAVPVAAEAVAWARGSQRRQLLDRTADTSAEAELMIGAAAEAAEFAEWADVTAVGSTALEQIEQDVRQIAREYLSMPPLPLLRRTLYLRNRVFGLIEGRHRPVQGRDLYLLAGRLCGMAAWMVGDLGWAAEAGTHARTAWVCADLADSPGLRGWVRATQSKLEYWDGRPSASARLAEDGLRYGVRDSGRLLLAGLAARGWARAGDDTGARRALGVAEEERDRITAEDEVGGIYGFSEAQHHYLTGTTFLWLREPERAQQAADRAVWLFELAAPRDRFYGPEALAMIDSAIAQVQTRQLDGAADRVESLLTLPENRRIDTIKQRIGDFQRSLRQAPAPIRVHATRMADDLADFHRAAG